MIKATELRIGNLVYEKHCDDTLHIGTVAMIQKIGDSAKVKTEKGWFAEKPISLTEEWLVKLGVKTSSDTCFELYVKDGYLCQDYSEGDGGTHCIAEVKYVHQLQNLYKALTGEELIIKQ